MSNKNPFEIRQEILELAKDYMDKQWEMNLEFTKSMYSQGNKNIDELQDAFSPYSMAELMERAKEMYSFVSKKD